MNVAAVFCGLGRLDLFDQRLLGLLLGRGDGDPLRTVGGGELLGVLDPLLLFDHRPFDDHPLADHFLDVPLLDFDRLVFFDVGQARRRVRVR